MGAYLAPLISNDRKMTFGSLWFRVDALALCQQIETIMTTEMRIEHWIKFHTTAIAESTLGKCKENVTDYERGIYEGLIIAHEASIKVLETIKESL